MFYLRRMYQNGAQSTYKPPQSWQPPEDLRGALVAGCRRPAYPAESSALLESAHLQVWILLHPPAHRIHFLSLETYSRAPTAAQRAARSIPASSSASPRPRHPAPVPTRAATTTPTPHLRPSILRCSATPSLPVNYSCPSNVSVPIPAVASHSTSSPQSIPHHFGTFSCSYGH